MTVKDMRKILSNYRDDEEIAIQINETVTGEYVDETYDLGISEIDIFGPVFIVNVEAGKFQRFQT